MNEQREEMPIEKAKRLVSEFKRGVEMQTEDVVLLEKVAKDNGLDVQANGGPQSIYTLSFRTKLAIALGMPEPVAPVEEDANESGV